MEKMRMKLRDDFVDELRRDEGIEDADVEANKKEEPLEETPEGEDELFKDDSDKWGDDYLGDDFLGEEAIPPMKKHQDLLKDLTNFSPYLKNCYNNWLGIIWDEESKKWIQDPVIKPVMKVQGANWCAGFLSTYTRSNNIITDINKEDYKDIMGDIVENIWLNLGTRDDIGIDDEGDLLRVANELEHASALALMGAGDGRYNKFLQTTINRHENVQSGFAGQDTFGQPIRNPQSRGPSWADKLKKLLS